MTHLKCSLSVALVTLALTARLCGAAISASAVFEVQPSSGADTNGGGFDSSIGSCGTDQTYPTPTVTSFTDLATTGVTTTITSATGGFTGTRCNALHITTTGTGGFCTRGWYFITSVTDNNTAVLDRAPTTAAGVACSGKIGGALQTLSQQTGVFVSNALAAGNTIYIKNESGWNEAVSLAGSCSGTAPCVLEGYNSTRGDAPTGSSRPRNNRAAASGIAVNQTGGHWIVKHLWISNAGSIGIDNSSGNNGTYVNVRSSNNGSIGIKTGSATTLVGCETDTNTGAGVTATSQSLLVYALDSHGNTSFGIDAGGVAITVLTSIIAANAAHGINNPASNIRVINTTIDANTGATTDGIGGGTSLATGALFLNNILSNNGRDGVRFSTNATGGWWDRNDYYGNTGTARTNVPTGPTEYALNPGYVAAGSGNYAIGVNVRNKAFPGTFPASTSTGFFDLGAVQTGIGSATQRAIGCVQ